MDYGYLECVEINKIVDKIVENTYEAINSALLPEKDERRIISMLAKKLRIKAMTKVEMDKSGKIFSLRLSFTEQEVENYRVLESIIERAVSNLVQHVGFRPESVRLEVK